MRRVLDRGRQQRVDAPRQTLDFWGRGHGRHRRRGAQRFSRRDLALQLPAIRARRSEAQIPLQVDLFYAPKLSSVFGGVSAGFGNSLSSLKIPLNAHRRRTGWWCAIEERPDPTPGAEAPILPVFGPTFGAALGVEAGWFRVELRVRSVDQRVAEVPAPTSIPTGSLRIGGAF